MKNVRDGGITDTQYIAFHPEQIKSAVGNRGTFDPNDPRITHAEGSADTASDAEQPHPHAIQAAVDAVVAMTGNRVRVEVLDTGQPGIVVKHPSGEDRYVDGYAIGRLIRVALNPRTAWNLGHEAVHGLRNMGLFTPAEWRTMTAQAEREGWAERFDIPRRYPYLDADRQAEEAIAEKFGHDAVNPPPTGSFMARMVGKVRQFLARLRNALMGRGFQTAEDVFGRIRSGEVGAREPGRGTEQRGPTDVASSEREAERFDSASHLRAAELPAVRALSAVTPQKAKDMADEVKKWLAPTSRGTGAKMMEYVVRGTRAKEAQSWERAKATLERIGHEVGRLPEEEQLAVTERMERGERQATPELQAIADTLRSTLDGWTEKIQALGKMLKRPLLENARENYMGHIWANYDEWAAGQRGEGETDEALRRAQASGASKTPLRGSGNFLKARTFETQAEGMAAGLKPITANPVEMQLIKLREMQRFYHGTLMAEGIKASGLAHWVPYHQEREAQQAGYVKLNDPLFQPRLRPEEVYGKLNVGGWYAPEPVARIFNNYASGGLAGRSAIYDSIRYAGNALNSAQLGLSGFHATFVTMDTMISRVGLGLQQMSRGEVVRGAANVATGFTPASIVRAVRDGSQLRAWYLGDAASLPPEARRMVEALNAAGGRISMDGFYNSAHRGAFIKHLSDLTRFIAHPADIVREVSGMAKESGWRTPFEIAGRILQTSVEPLMGWLVPRAKLGVFYSLADDWMRRNPDASPIERSEALTKAWDSVDNRLGQMVYDNLFWNKTQKDLAFIGVRSVGWNLGTIRELAGGGVDTLEQAAKALHLQAPELTHRMAYALAMPLTVGLYGALMTYLVTGAAPQNTLDYFFPPDGKGGRLIIPSYVKDVIEYTRDPGQTIANKLHPFASMVQQIYSNRDYYGDIIYYPPADNPASAYGDYLLNQSMPFAVRAMLRQNASGRTPLEQALSFWGFQPAPQSIAAPEKSDAWRARQDRMAYRRREKSRAKGLIQ